MNNSIFFQEQDQTGIISLNNPDSLNALNLEMAELFSKKIVKWKNDKNIKRVLLKGKGKAFCAGQDLNEAIDPRCQMRKREQKTPSSLNRPRPG